jgi:Tol biopolymer transport system component
MLTGRTTGVSVASDGTEAVGESYNGVISGDGSWVVFVSDAANLVPGDTNSFREVFLHDNVSGATTRVCAGLGGVQCDQSSTTPAIDRVGSRIVFASEARNVVADDHNHATGIFVRYADPAAN